MKIRTECPKNNKYYIRISTGGYNGAVAGQPMQPYANVLDNCVGYANGRFNEIGEYGKCKYQLVCNAENFIEAAKKMGLKISSTPIEGGIMVWQKGATLGGGDGAGHVAVVERVYDDGSIMTSESGWNSWAFKTVRRDNTNGRWGQRPEYRFRGCIINPAVKDPKVVPVPPLTIDGVGGACTVRAMQRFFGTLQDGVLSGQSKSCEKYYPALKAVEFGKGGSTCVKKLQKWLGIDVDGVWGKDTSKALQKKLGVDADGVFGTNSMKAWQKYLNENKKAVYPKQSPEVIDVSYVQTSIDWNKVKAAGIKGAIIRCGFRGAGTAKLREDDMYQKHIKGAHEAGMPIGIYMFTEAINAAEGKAEAEYAIKLWKKFGYPLSFPIAVDTEDVFWYETKNGKKVKCKGRANSGVLSKAKRTEAIKAFCEEVIRQGYKPMIYASLSWLDNQLDMSKLPYDVWVAQYNSTCDYKGKYILWQYTSSGNVNGIKGSVDMSKFYSEYLDMNPDQGGKDPEPEKKAYTGKYPSTKLEKTAQQVIDDALLFSKWIVNDNRFGYGRQGGSKYKDCKAYHITHSGGCHFCGSNAHKIAEAKKAGLKDPEQWEYTYVCNTFVHACYAHSGVPSMLKAKGHAWWIGSYQKSKYWTEIKKPSKITDLKPGDVLAWGSNGGTSGHFCMYVGNGKGREATSGGLGATFTQAQWNKTIRETDFSRHFKAAQHVFRFTGSINTTAYIRYGEVSDRVKHLQGFLKWYGCDISADKCFGDATLKAVKKFQKDQGITVDGIVGSATIAKMKSVRK